MKIINDPVYIIAAPAAIVMMSIETPDLLSNEERKRRYCFLHQKDRDLFDAAHSLKRWITAQCSGKANSELNFRSTETGKPYLLDSAINFNISHSGDWVAIAISKDGPVGVDIEIDHSTNLWREIMPNVSQDTEIKNFYDNPLHLWTAKEAVLKMLGTGFSTDPKNLRVSYAGDAFEACLDNQSFKGSWQMADQNHLAAVVTNYANPVYQWTICLNVPSLRRAINKIPQRWC